MSNNTVVIVDGARTPMGGLLGSLSAVTAPELASTAIAEALSRSGLDPAAVDEVFMGCVLPAGLKQCPARQAAIAAGIPKSAGAVTVNKACGSGMQAAIFGYDSIIAGTNKVVVAGGMESMSNAPHLLIGARGGLGGIALGGALGFVCGGYQKGDAARLGDILSQKPAGSNRVPLSGYHPGPFGIGRDGAGFNGKQ